MRSESDAVVAAAHRVVGDAAARTGLAIRSIDDLAGEAKVGELFDRVWGTDGQPVMPANLLRAVNHAGNYLGGAFDRDGGRLIGASFGFLGRNDHEIFMHSHMTGVDPGWQRSGVGFALKLHQRAWALSHGIGRIEWTFDPLVRRNAYFNLVKLGTEIVDYHENFYGEMPDGINSGDESDRVLVSWDLASERVARACEEGLAEPDLDDFRSAGAGVALDIDADGRPVVNEAGAPRLLCRIPDDIVRLRRDDPESARLWRRALRQTLGRAVLDGYRAGAITRDGWYLLERRGAP